MNLPRIEKPKTGLIIGLSLVILLQTGILAMIYINAQVPLWTGRPIILKTRPVDPRSLFRGNYALLDYDISRIPAKDINRLGIPRPNERVYVRLTPGPDQIYTYQGISFEKPESGVFIRGRIQDRGRRSAESYRVRYGIEAYFAPKEKALALEKQLRTSAVARIYISDSGKSALEGIYDK